MSSRKLSEGASASTSGSIRSVRIRRASTVQPVVVSAASWRGSIGFINGVEHNGRRNWPVGSERGHWNNVEIAAVFIGRLSEQALGTKAHFLVERFRARIGRQYRQGNAV